MLSPAEEQCSTAMPANVLSEHFRCPESYDSAVPFDAREIIDCLRFERYVEANSTAAHHVARKLYYTLRPMLTAPVEVVEPTGAETHAVLKIAEQEIVGRFDPDGAPRLGENLPLGIDMSHVCLFDPETQALIPQVAA